VIGRSAIENSLKSIAEAPYQLKAATDAYNQKQFYIKRACNIVDVQQALFTLTGRKLITV